MGVIPAGVQPYLEERTNMELTLTDAEAAELRDLLDGSLGDLSTEIADTDNPSYRLSLKARRSHLRSVRARLTPVG
jgi:hypothetical protein